MADFTSDDLHLIRWLTAGHKHEQDEDVQRLIKKVVRLLEKPKKVPFVEETFPAVDAEALRIKKAIAPLKRLAKLAVSKERAG